MRRVLTALLVGAAWTSSTLLGAPASAETRNFSAARGTSDSASTDVVFYRVTTTPTRTSISYAFAAPNTAQLSSIVFVDTDGDGQENYEIFDTGTVFHPDFTEACRAATSREGAGVTFTLRTSCLGSPTSLRVRIYASNGRSFDFVPGVDAWSPLVRQSTGASAPAPVPEPRLDIALSPPAIARGESSRVWVAALPGEKVVLYAHTAPSTTYRLVRTGTTNAAGLASWPVRPVAGTRLYAAPDGGPATRDSPAVVLSVSPRPLP